MATTAQAENYDIWVGGVQVTSANASNVTGGDIKGGTVTYHHSDGILTLKDVTITRSGKGNQGIRCSIRRGVTIRLEGTNTITTDNSCALRVDENTQLYSTTGSTTTFTEKQQEAIYVTGGSWFGFSGPDVGSGAIIVNSTSEYAIEGEKGTEIVSFNNSSVTLNGKKGSLVKLGKVNFAERTYKYKMSSVTLKATNNSSYPQVQNVAAWVENGYNHIDAPIGGSCTHPAFISSSKTIIKPEGLSGDLTSYDIVINEDVVQLNSTYFPDANFLTEVKNLCGDENGYKNRGFFSKAMVKKVTHIRVANKNISNLKGVEHFTELTSLECQNNNLTTLDVSNNMKLRWLYVNNNSLTSLDASMLSNLETLKCHENQLTSLKVSTSAVNFSDIECQLNKINGQSAKDFVNSLPSVGSGNLNFQVINSTNEGNIFFKPQVGIAIAKGWNARAQACDNCVYIGFNGLPENPVIKTSVAPTDGGTVTGGGTKVYGASVTLKATPSTGYKFMKWKWFVNGSGAKESTVNPYTFVANDDRDFEAVFERLTYSITASASPAAGGTVTGGGTKEYYGATVALQATPNTGYKFVRWTENGSQVSTNAYYTFKVDKARTLQAVFEKLTYNITASASPIEGGTVSGGGTKEHGSSVTLTATPNTGYNFVRWTENGSQVSTNASYTFTVGRDRTLVAVFEEEGGAVTAYELTVVSPTNGTLTTSPSGYISEGTEVTLTATPASGYKLKALKAYKTGEPSTTVAITGNKFNMPGYPVTVEAEFEEEASVETYYLLTVVSPTNGTLTASPSGYISEGTEVTLTATPASGYKLKALKAYKTGEPSTTVAISENKFNMPGYPVTVEAEFEEEASVETYYLLTVVSPTNGTLTASPSGYISEGTEVTLTATPASGYKLKALKAYKTGEASTTVAINGNKFNMPAYEVTVEAEFEKTSSGGDGGGGSTTYYTLSYIASAGGSIKGASVQTVKQGESGTEVEAVASDGYRFMKWSDGRTTAKRTDSNVQANLSVTAEFEKQSSDEGSSTGLFDNRREMLSAYPNPTTGMLWVSVPEPVEGTAANVLVYNIAGQLLQRVPARAASTGSAASRMCIDLSSYPSGLYIIRVGNAVAKVVKQ